MTMSRATVSASQSSAEPAEEPLRTVEFAPNDALLREDVKTVGALVGEDLADEGADGFDVLAQERVGGGELDDSQGFFGGLRNGLGGGLDGAAHGHPPSLPHCNI